ncbi:MarR family winged helix-turn-helix transcriptional regulator [Nocardia sp. NPDC004750]
MGAAWSQVAAFASVIDASLDKWLATGYRIGLTEYRALTLLSRASDKELRVNDLAQRVGLTQSSTTRLVSRLEAKGLAHRDICSDDGRGVYAVIDESGERLLREVCNPYQTRVAELLSAPSASIPHINPSLIAAALAGVAEVVGRNSPRRLERTPPPHINA